MKKLLILGTALALVACSKKEETTVTTATETPAAAPMETATATQAATGSMAGKYESVMADGKKMTSTINPDGTYVDVMDGKETKGTWRMDGAKACFDEEGAAPEMCYTSSKPGVDGSFTMMGPDGKVTQTVRKIGA